MMTAGCRLGLLTPIVTLLPGEHGDWERDGSVEDLVAIARRADRLGFHHLTCSEHVAVPAGVATVRGTRYWDPSATLAFLAAATRRIRLATHVVVLGYHHPLELAKRYGTVDTVSHGRLVLGVGIGTLVEEFGLLERDFSERGPRADEAIRALRPALSKRKPVFEGTYYRFRDFVVDPAAIQPRVPIWVGGRTYRSLIRAVSLADGWVPFGCSAAGLRELLGRMRETPDWARRAEPFELVFTPTAPIDPLGEPYAAREAIDELLSAGATIVNVRVRAHSAVHYVEQLEALAELVHLEPPATAVLATSGS